MDEYDALHKISTTSPTLGVDPDDSGFKFYYVFIVIFVLVLFAVLWYCVFDVCPRKCGRKPLDAESPETSVRFRQRSQSSVTTESFMSSDLPRYSNLFGDQREVAQLEPVVSEMSFEGLHTRLVLL